MASGKMKRRLLAGLVDHAPHSNAPFIIIHRIAGLYTLFGAWMYALWMVMVAAGAEVFRYYTMLQYSWLGGLLLFLWVFSMFFHLLAGIRYMFWHWGIGREPHMMTWSGYLVLLGSFVIANAAWFSMLGL